MKKYIIERDLPGAGKLTQQELEAIAKKSCEGIADMGVPYFWIETFVTDNKLYCIHIAQDKETVIKHAKQCGFPVSRITEVKNVIDPTTGG